MKKHLFIGDFDFTNQNLAIKNKELINQIKNVLRFKKNDVIFLGNSRKIESEAKILEIKKNEITIKIINTESNNNEYKKDATLYLSILKKENFELVIQKATEIGIRTIIPVISERTVKTGLKIERLKKIIKEAGEQSGRGVLPLITEPIKFKDSIDHASKNELNLFFHISGKALDKIKPDQNKIGIFIGPEGGWSDSEIAAIKKRETFTEVSLGRLTLRGETAAIVACYLGLQ